MFLATSERYFSGYIIFVYFVYFPIVFPTTEIPLYVYTEDVFEFSEAGRFPNISSECLTIGQCRGLSKIYSKTHRQPRCLLLSV